MTRFEEKVSASLAGFVVALVPYAFTMLLLVDVPPTTRDIVMVLVGVIAANATQAVQHRFGSNPASQRKDETISTLADTAKSAQAAASKPADPITTPPPTDSARGAPPPHNQELPR